MKLKSSILLFFALFYFLFNSTNINAQPSNDECVNAIDISSLFNGTCGAENTSMPFGFQDAAGNPATLGANDPAEPDCFVDNAITLENSIWFTFTVPDINGDGSAVAYSINTDCDGLTSPLGGDCDTELALYDGSAGCPDATNGPSNYVACNEDLFAAAPWISGFDVNLIPGNVYYMMVDTWDAVTANAVGDGPGEFVFDVTVCGVVCGDAVCAVTETYCSCSADCVCDLVEGAFVNTDLFFTTDCNADNVFTTGDYIIENYGFGDPNSLYLLYGIIAGDDCNNITIPGATVTYDNGVLLDVNSNNLPSGSIAPELTLLFFELDAAAQAAGGINITLSVDDGVGNTCDFNQNVVFGDCNSFSNPVDATCLAGTLDSTLSPQTVTPNSNIDFCTLGDEDLTLPTCATGYVYAVSVWGDPYSTGTPTAQLSDWNVVSSPCTNIAANTVMLDESGYYYPAGQLPFGTYYLQGAAICFDTYGNILTGCFSGSFIQIDFEEAPACEPANVDFAVDAAGCDMTGATIELQDSYGAPIASAALGVDGGSGSFGTFPCGVYQIVIVNAPACYTDMGGDVGPRLFTLDGEDVSEFFSSMPEVPTLSQWGLITLALLLATFGAITMSATKLAFAGTSTVPMPFTNINLPFNAAILRKALMLTGIAALIGFVICFAIYGAIFMPDIIGVAIAGPVFAYLMHLIYLIEKK